MRRDSGEGYREVLRRLAEESGIATPTADDLIRMDKTRKGKKLSNEDWESPTDPDGRIAKMSRSAGAQRRRASMAGPTFAAMRLQVGMKDGRTRLGYKPEHAVDLDTGAIVATPIHGADQGDTKTLPGTLEAAEQNLEVVGMEPSPEDPAELMADKGYHSRGGLKDLEDSEWTSRISEPKPKGILPRLQERSSEGRARHAGSSPRCGCRPEHRWKGDDEARRAFYNNRNRLLSEVARQAFKLRAELVERSFALTLDRGGMRRTWLRGRDNVQKRYLIHISGYNLGLIMRLLTGSGTPRRWADANIAIIWLRYPIDDQTVALLSCLVVTGGLYRGTVLARELVLFNL